MAEFAGTAVVYDVISHQSKSTADAAVAHIKAFEEVEAVACGHGVSIRLSGRWQKVLPQKLAQPSNAVERAVNGLIVERASVCTDLATRVDLNALTLTL